jgi:hypothetical protein
MEAHVKKPAKSQELCRLQDEAEGLRLADKQLSPAKLVENSAKDG